MTRPASAGFFFGFQEGSCGPSCAQWTLVLSRVASQGLTDLTPTFCDEKTYLRCNADVSSACVNRPRLESVEACGFDDGPVTALSLVIAETVGVTSKARPELSELHIGAAALMAIDLRPNIDCRDALHLLLRHIRILHLFNDLAGWHRCRFVLARCPQ